MAHKSASPPPPSNNGLTTDYEGHMTHYLDQKKLHFWDWLNDEECEQKEQSFESNAPGWRVATQQN
jgi:hypothetical protein